MSLTIQRVYPESAEALSAVAFRSYFEHYRNDWHDSGQWYANKSFSVKQFEQELADEKNYFFMAVYDNENVGFLKLCPDNELVDQAGKGFEIERIYLTKAAKGKGIGKAFMEFSFEMARQLNKNYVWLKAKDTSEAKTFYDHMGFEIIGAFQLDFEQMKIEKRGMLIMKKPL